MVETKNREQKVVSPIEEIDSWYAYIIESEFGVIDTIQSHLVTHIFNSYTRYYLQIVVTNGYHEPVDAVLLSCVRIVC